MLLYLAVHPSFFFVVVVGVHVRCSRPRIRQPHRLKVQQFQTPLLVSSLALRCGDEDI